MKKITMLLMVAIWLSVSMYGQVAINTDGSAADPSAILDVKSTTSGFLAPRMTEVQRDAIASPAAGLLIYCTDCANGAGFYFNSTEGSSNWSKIGSGTVATSVTVSNPGTSSGTFIVGQAILDGQATFTITNNSLITVGPINFNNAATLGTGTAAFSVPAAVTSNADYSSVTIDPGSTFDLIYDITGTASTAGTIVVDFNSVGGLSASASANVCELPAQPSVISGSISTCVGTTDLAYSVADVSGITYAWTVPSGWTITAGQGTNSITANTGTQGLGDINVEPSNSCGNGPSSSLTVNVSDVPSQPSTITGASNECLGATGETYSVTNVTGASYAWTVPADWTITAGQGTNSITVTVGSTSGDVSVTPSNGCGNGTPRTLAVTVGTIPTQPSTITGSTVVCSGTTGLIYSVTNVAGVSYTWTVPSGWTITAGQGTNSITTTAGTSGSISVTPSNSCGDGASQTLVITPGTVPAQPSVITGTTSTCGGTTGLTYSVTNVSGVTYAWTVPSGWTITAGQGTNSITATASAFGGDISVVPSNSCGNGSSRTLTISVWNVPSQPSAISGPTVVVPSQAGLIYSVTNMPGVSFAWTIPSGWSITSGQGTNSITVTAGATTGGNINVVPSNGCGSGTSRTLAVIISTVPVVYNTTTGEYWMDRNLGASRVATYASDAQAYGDLYQWGRLADGHEKRTSGQTSTTSSQDVPGHDLFIEGDYYHDGNWRVPKNDNLWQGVNGINNPCPTGFRLPTKTEWEAEIATWSSQNITGAYTSTLKLTTGGMRYYSGGYYYVDTNGYYWSSTVDGNGSDRLILNTASMGWRERGVGFSVRCIKD